MEKKNEKKKAFPSYLYILIIITAFLFSFVASAYIYLNINKLIISDNAFSVRELTLELSDKNAEIIELKKQLSRYKDLYEDSLDVINTFNDNNEIEH